MSSYFLYRINTGYDGFVPSRLPHRTKNGKMLLNWGAYVENLERDDIVLTYFTGTGCRKGVYAVGAVKSVDLSKSTANVKLQLLGYSAHDRRPLIPRAGHESLFEQLSNRRRGAEVVIPQSQDAAVFSALTQLGGVIAEARKRTITLPGSTPLNTNSLANVPRISANLDLSPELRERGVTATYWIRPNFAVWMGSTPDWLRFMTRVFGTFKSGDLTRLDALADAMAAQIRDARPHLKWITGTIVSVPLNAQKKADGEVDRVAELAKALSGRLAVPYTEAFELSGNVSRRRYKNLGHSETKFRTDYLANLRVVKTEVLAKCIADKKEILLIDDVFTDGVTTSLVSGALRATFPGCEVTIRIATLGAMAKKDNMDSDLIDRWE